MTLPSNGVISLNDVRKELNITGSVSLGDTSVRNLAGISSGKISMKDLYGKSEEYIGKLTIGGGYYENPFFIQWNYGYSAKTDSADQIGNLNPVVFLGG